MAVELKPHVNNIVTRCKAVQRAARSIMGSTMPFVHRPWLSWDRRLGHGLKVLERRGQSEGDGKEDLMPGEVPKTLKLSFCWNRALHH